MTESLASLGIKVETSEVKKADTDLDNLTAAAQRTDKAVEKLGPTFTQTGAQAQAAAAKVRGSTGSYGKHGQEIEAAGLSAKQYAQALRLLPAQITDVVTSLASGSPAYLVAIQQGGQLRDSFNGIGAALRAVATLITPTTLAIGGAIVTVLGLAKAYYDGQKQGFEFAKAIEMTGNAAGTTAGQLEVMSDNIDDIIGTQAQAAAVLATIAGTGQVAAKNLQEFALVAERLQRTVGQPIKETAKQFAELGRKPVEASQKLQAQYGYLTSAVYDQIAALEKEGNLQEAASLAQTAFADAMEKRVGTLETRLGLLQKTGQGVKDFFSEFWDEVLAVGREDTPEQELAALQERRGGRQLFTGDIRNTARDQRESALQADVDAAKEAAESERQLLNVQNILIGASSELEKLEKQRLQTAKQMAKARFGFDLSAIQRDLDASVAQYAQYESELSAERKAGLVDETTYYAERRKLIEQNRDAQLQALEAENARIRLEKSTGPELLANQQRIAENESRLAIIRGNASAQLKVLSIEQAEANRQTIQGYNDAREAAERYLAVLENQFSAEVEGLGKGNRQRQRDQGRNRIDDRFAEQELELSGELRRKEITEDQYDQQLKIIQEFHKRSTDAYDRYWKDLEDKQGSFFVGAQEAIANYIDEAQNMAKQSENFFGTLFSGAEDAVIKFATTGKLEIKDLANTILEEFLRIQLKSLISGALQSSTGSLLGTIFGSLFGAIGATGGTGAGMGTVPSGSGALFADTGIKRVPKDNQPTILHKDEAVLPRSMNPWAGGRGVGGSTVHQTNYFGSGLTVGQFLSYLPGLKDQVKGEIADDMNRGRWPMPA